MPNLQDPMALDAARRQWLAGLAQAHAADSAMPTALAFARGAWMCGEYELALDLFQRAHAADPRDIDALLALVHGASMLTRFDIEAQALDTASAHGVSSARLSLHRALKRVPAGVDEARAMLAAHGDDPLCVEFDVALSAIEAGDASLLPQRTDPRAHARDAGLRWALRHAGSTQAHVGLPVDVLLAGLDDASVDGLMIECGVYFGRSLRIIAERGNGKVHGFDSFQGLPEAWNAAEPMGAYSTAGRLPKAANGVTLHAGWFEDTLPAFFAAHPEPIRLLHVDCDLYSSTQTVLAHARPHLVPGSVVVFDDLLGYPGYEAHEFKAWNEFTAAQEIRWELLAACLLGREVAVRLVSA